MAPTSSSTEIHALVEAELQQPLEKLFSEWDEKPIASASIGQVHRARLFDGTEVAVKVQHPGVEHAVESDLNNAGLLERVAATAAGTRFQTKAWLDIIRARFLDELDYALEAQRQEHFAALHAEDPHVKVPRIVKSHCSRRVLTSEFVRGLTSTRLCLRPKPIEGSGPRHSGASSSKEPLSAVCSTPIHTRATMCFNPVVPWLF